MGCSGKIEEENDSLKKQSDQPCFKQTDSLLAHQKEQENIQANLLKVASLPEKKDSFAQKVASPPLTNPKKEEAKEEPKPKDLQKSIKEPTPLQKPIGLNKKDETLMRFAAVELEGALKINSTR